jgi:ParB-like chromosome segregation protein Spo0J
MATAVKSAFRPNVLHLEIKSLVPSRAIDAHERSHQKYKQIAASIASIGLIEPPVVFPIEGGRYRVLDGHRRLDILKARRVRHVDCLLSTDDEAYTYNRRVNYLSTVSEHHMILRALEHNTEARIAEALNVDVATIREKCRLLNGVCKEAIEILEENFGDRVFASRIKKTVRFAEAPVKGMSVLKYDPDGMAAQSYRDLAKEVLANGKR